ncbi:MAG: TIGR04423 family type III CRISPR-associated protein [Bacteroidales bacterium]|nr:TIGR04423 family type III CRISPR-associated protein [Bacteroidales bacterium]
MKIDKSKYIGYIWLSNATKPEILPSEGELDTDSVEIPFIIEGQMVDKEKTKSISIKFVDGKTIVKEYNLVDYKEFEEEEFIPNRMDGKEKLLFKRVWRIEKDDLCEGWEVLQPAELVFVGFKEKEDKDGKN